MEARRFRCERGITLVDAAAAVGFRGYWRVTLSAYLDLNMTCWQRANGRLCLFLRSVPVSGCDVERLTWRTHNAIHSERLYVCVLDRSGIVAVVVAVVTVNIKLIMTGISPNKEFLHKYGEKKKRNTNNHYGSEIVAVLKNKLIMTGIFFA